MVPIVPIVPVVQIVIPMVTIIMTPLVTTGIKILLVTRTIMFWRSHCWRLPLHPGSLPLPALPIATINIYKRYVYQILHQEILQQEILDKVVLEQEILHQETNLPGRAWWGWRCRLDGCWSPWLSWEQLSWLVRAPVRGFTDRQTPVQVGDCLVWAAHLNFPLSLLAQEQEALHQFWKFSQLVSSPKRLPPPTLRPSFESCASICLLGDSLKKIRWKVIFINQCNRGPKTLIAS